LLAFASLRAQIRGGGRTAQAPAASRQARSYADACAFSHSALCAFLAAW
jgi:hypothetical protein